MRQDYYQTNPLNNFKDGGNIPNLFFFLSSSFFGIRLLNRQVIIGKTLMHSMCIYLMKTNFQIENVFQKGLFNILSIEDFSCTVQDCEVGGRNEVVECVFVKRATYLFFRQLQHFELIPFFKEEPHSPSIFEHFDLGTL